MRLSSLLSVDKSLTIPNRIVDWVYILLRKIFPARNVNTNKVLVIKLMGMGSLIKLTSIFESNQIDLDAVTICTFKQNQEICKILGYPNAIFIEDSWSKLLAQVLLFPFNNSFDLVIDAERNVNSSSLFRKYIALIGRAESVCFDFNPDKNNKSDIGFSIMNRSHSELLKTLIPLLKKKDGQRSKSSIVKPTTKKNQILFNINASEYLFARRYPISSFVGVMQAVHQYNPHCKLILTGVKSEELYVKDLANKLTALGIPYENVCGKWGVGKLKIEMEKALCFVTNDSGPMHLAVLLKVPTVVIWGPTQADYSGYRESEFLKNVSLNMSCSPCFINSDSDMGASCHKRISCMKDLGSSLVFEKVKEILTEK